MMSVSSDGPKIKIDEESASRCMLDHDAKDDSDGSFRIRLDAVC